MRSFHITWLICLIVWTASAQTSLNGPQSIGNESARSYQTGSFYLQGHDGPIDYTKSYQEFLKGVNTGYAPSFYALGYLYFKGLGVQQDYFTAVNYFEKAAKAGIAEADMMIGSCYYHGVGKIENIDSALFHLRKAAVSGSTQAYAIHKRIVELGSRSYSELPRKPLDSPLDPTWISNQYIRLKDNEAAILTEGTWEGLWVTYDWSSNKIMDQATIYLSITKVDEATQYTVKFLESDLDLFDTQTFVVLNNGTSTSGVIEKRAFTGELRNWQINRVSYAEETISGAPLQLNIQSFSPSTNEPGQPISVFLRPSDHELDPFENVSGLKVFPNPSTDFFTVQLNLPKAMQTSVRVFSLDGKEVIKLDGEDFPSGITQRQIKWPTETGDGVYVVKILGDKYVKSTSIIKR